MTRIRSLARVCGASQSSALASTTIGNSASRQSRRVMAFTSSGKSGAARPGPIKIALAASNSFISGLPQIHHDGLQLRGDGVINIFLREQGDEAGLRALRAARGQDRRAMKSETARDDRQMPERAFVVRDRAARREIRRNPPATSSSIRPAMRTRAGDQADVVGHFEPPDERPGALGQQADFRRADRQGDGGFDRRALHFAGVRVQAGRHVHGQDGNF